MGGVIDVRERADDVEYVQVVNFYNPQLPRRTPAELALRTAIQMNGARLRYATLASLIAFKLDAGGPKDRVDALELLAKNPDADTALIRDACREANLESELDRLLADAGIIVPGERK